MVVCISVGLVVISPWLFFIASIQFLSLFFFINLASGLSILLIFSKNQLLNSLIFWRFFCVPISFSSALILVISCLLLAFEFFWSCSSSSFNFDYRVLILDLSLLLIWVFIAINLPMDIALNVSRILVCCIFILVGFEEHLYLCLHFIVKPINIQELVVQFPWSCVDLN